MDPKELKELKEEIDRLEKEQWGVNDRIFKLKDKLLKICTHPSTTPGKRYIEGGYLNVSEYHTFEICDYCNTTLNEKVKYGNYA
jgi:hypothetical protein